MKKVLLVTLQGDNIGNRLQNYALQTTVQSMGCEVYTPDYGLIEFPNFTFKAKFKIKSVLGKLHFRKYQKPYFRNERIKKYKQFNDRYISNLFKTSFVKMFNCKSIDRYEYAITGSDQVWHKWSGDELELKYFYLEFLPRNKRISYAASFGFDNFPKTDLEAHRAGLKGMYKISCREKSGVQLVNELVGLNAEQVLDPTLLLGKNEWQKISCKPEWVNDEDYLLCYFLGHDSEYRKTIGDFAVVNNLKIIEAYRPENLQAMLISPDEFIWLVHHAEYVCTDSFHATVFSILFEKKFLSFRRNEPGMEKMFDRIEDVLELFGVSDRVYKGSIDAIKNEYILNDISQEKETSLNFLRESLGIKDE